MVCDRTFDKGREGGGESEIFSGWGVGRNCLGSVEPTHDLPRAWKILHGRRTTLHLKESVKWFGRKRKRERKRVNHSIALGGFFFGKNYFSNFYFLQHTHIPGCPCFLSDSNSLNSIALEATFYLYLSYILTQFMQFNANHATQHILHNSRNLAQLLKIVRGTHVPRRPCSPISKFLNFPVFLVFPTRYSFDVHNAYGWLS